MYAGPMEKYELTFVFSKHSVNSEIWEYLRCGHIYTPTDGNITVRVDLTRRGKRMHADIDSSLRCFVSSSFLIWEPQAHCATRGHALQSPQHLQRTRPGGTSSTFNDSTWLLFGMEPRPFCKTPHLMDLSCALSSTSKSPTPGSARVTRTLHRPAALVYAYLIITVRKE